jgi:hypothetical protein
MTEGQNYHVLNEHKLPHSEQVLDIIQLRPCYRGMTITLMITHRVLLFSQRQRNKRPSCPAVQVSQYDGENVRRGIFPALGDGEIFLEDIMPNLMSEELISMINMSSIFLFLFFQ